VVWNAVGSALFAANTLVMVVVVSRTSSVAAVGCFGIALAVAQLLYLVGLFGVNLFQMTDYKRQYAFADYAKARMLTCLLMALACVPLVAWGMAEPEKRLFTALLVAFFLTHAFGDLYQSLLFREDRLDLSGQALAFRVGAALLAFVVVQALTASIGLALAASTLASLLGILLWGARWARPYHRGLPGARPGAARALLKECLPLFVASFLVLLVFNAPRYGIDYLMDDEAQGYFSMIVLPALVINLISQFVFNPALSSIARALRDADRRGFHRLVAQKAAVVVAMTALVALAMPPLGIPLLTLLYAVDLGGFPLEASLLIVGGGLFALNQLLYSVLVIMRRQKGILLAYSIGAAAAAAMTVLAIVGLGLTGACVAFVLSQVPVLVLFGIMVLVGTRRLGAEGAGDAEGGARAS
jgi:O-antigen/teichoic acid export membrane protein